jgi:hypothetical protein
VGRGGRRPPGLAGCAAYRQLVGEDTVSLQNGDVQRMEVDIRRPVKRICPREPVQMLVTVDARLEGQSSVTRIETWEGNPSVRRNGNLEFGNFRFVSRQGTLDEFGSFLPNGDMLASVEIRDLVLAPPDQALMLVAAGTAATAD